MDRIVRPVLSAFMQDDVMQYRPNSSKFCWRNSSNRRVSWDAMDTAHAYGLVSVAYQNGEFTASLTDDGMEAMTEQETTDAGKADDYFCRRHQLIEEMIALMKEGDDAENDRRDGRVHM